MLFSSNGDERRLLLLMEACFEEHLVNFVHHIGADHVVNGQAAFFELLFGTTWAVLVWCWHIYYLYLSKTLMVWIDIQIVVLSERSYGRIELLKIKFRRLLLVFLRTFNVIILKFIAKFVFFLLFHILTSI